MDLVKTLLVVLQNAYTKTEAVKDNYVPALDCPVFQNSHTGRRLKNAIPDNINVQIINANPDVGNNADSNFPPDTNYVMAKINEHQPNIILACGKNARQAIPTINIPVITMPHPAYRALTNQTIQNTKETINAYI